MTAFVFRLTIATLLLGICLAGNGVAQEAADKKESEPVVETKEEKAKAEVNTEEKQAEPKKAEEEKASNASEKSASPPEEEPKVKAEKAEVKNTEETTEVKAGNANAKEEHAPEHKHEAKEVHAVESGHGAGHGHGDSHGHGLTAENTDLSHANGTSQLNSPAEFRFDLAIATALVFLVLLTILTKFAWGPISSALEQREHHIADMIATAEKNAKASEHRMQELEAQLAAQAESAREAINAARREGEVQKEKIIAQARQAAEHEKNRALADIRDAKNLALREIAQKSVNTAVDLAKNIIRREVKAEDHKQLIQDSLAQFHSSN